MPLTPRPPALALAALAVAGLGACLPATAPAPRAGAPGLPVAADAGAVLAPGSRWRVTALADLPVPPEPPITLIRRGAELSGNTGCNDWTGRIATDGPRLTITAGGMTERGCAPEIMAREAALMRQLARADRLSASAGGPVLLLAGTAAAVALAPG